MWSADHGKACGESKEPLPSIIGQLIHLKAMAREKWDMKNELPKDVMSWLLRVDEDRNSPVPMGEGAYQEDSRLMVIAGR